MFPDGFELQSTPDGYRLLFNGRAIATATDLERGGCRICRHPSIAQHMDFGFAPSRAAAVRYLERWVGRWEAELRALYAAAGARGYFSSGRAAEQPTGGAVARITG